MPRWKILIIKYMRNNNANEFWRGIDESWNTFSPHDKLEVFYFLYNSGQWRIYTELFIGELSKPEPVLNWLHLLSIFMLQKVPIEPAQKMTLLKQLKKIKVNIKSFEKYKELVDALKKKRKYNFLSGLQQKKQELLASVKIATSEQLYEQQLSYLEELQRRFPNDTSIRADLHQRHISDAEKVLNRSKRNMRQYSEEMLRQRKEEEPFIKNLLKQCRKIVKKHDHLRVDIAIMFRQMGYFMEALEFIEEKDSDERIAWLLFDFFLSAKQYISLLNHCERMKLRFAHRPEALFSISYYEALTYWELDERNKAIELMRHISTMKPTFRFASELLYRWQEEAN